MKRIVVYLASILLTFTFGVVTKTRIEQMDCEANGPKHS